MTATDINVARAKQDLSNAAGKTRLDPELKEAWIQALRSGRYDQGRGGLISCYGSHCCLGVLAAEAGVSPDTLKLCGFLSRVCISNVKDAALLGALSDAVPKRLQQECADMNDVLRMDFDQIADVIEEVL